MKELLFIHIPKNAGRNIKNRLMHLNFQSMGHKPVFKRPDYKSKYTFAVVRNPWERELSLWSHFGRSFDIMLYLKTAISGWPSRPSDSAPTLPVITLNQCDYICIDGKIAVDKILRFEYLQSDLNKMLEELDYPPIKLTHTHKGHYDKAELTSEARNIISSLREKDIELWESL